MDTAKIISAISVKPDWLIVDHYVLDERWEGALRPYAHRIFFIDDHADRVHDYNLLLDQNLITDKGRSDGFRSSLAGWTGIICFT